MPELHKSLVLKALDDLKAQNIVDLDVKDVSSFADNIIIASGTSSTHVKAIANNLMKVLKENGIETVSKTGYESCEWILVDIGDIVVNIMQPRVRDFYHLEGLWQPHPSKTVVNS